MTRMEAERMAMELQAMERAKSSKKCYWAVCRNGVWEVDWYYV